MGQLCFVRKSLEWSQNGENPNPLGGYLELFHFKIIDRIEKEKRSLQGLKMSQLCFVRKSLEWSQFRYLLVR